MDITSSLRDRGLNPASYFSLNFFDPISEILIEYGGAKEFLEGDAIILSFFEHEDRPEGWYSVARACALAVRMLRITEQYNANNQNNHLPLLEFGIGICYQQGPPTFLFDGDNRITISPAINLADRLSSCDKILRRQFRNQSQIFNLFVYQSIPEKELSETADDDLRIRKKPHLTSR
jgi:class 3 adenylate cyclase